MQKKWRGIIGILVLLSLAGGVYLFQTFSSPPETPLPKQPNDWFYTQRSFPGSSINITAWQEAQVQAAKMRRDNALKTSQWQQMGPLNIGGRITAMAAHPEAPNQVYIGAANGGVWVTENGGTSWTPLFDDVGTQSIGALAIDPTNRNIIYVGTGEANINADSYPGTGIYKSTNGGFSWEYSGLPNSHHIGRISIDPQNPLNIFAAVSGVLFGKNNERGIYRSSDGGASWTQSLFISDSTAAIDVVVDPLNPNNVYAAMWERIRYPQRRVAGGVTSGIYRSTDSGDNWDLLTNGLPPQISTIGRIGLGLAPSDPQTIYAIYADHPGFFYGVYKTTNGGDNWQQVNDGALSGVYSSFGWYFGNIYVDPTNADVAYVLGLEMFRTTNGGDSWTVRATDMHVDHHAIWINPANPLQVYVGNDGGFYSSQNGANTSLHSETLPISQFYAATVDFNNPHRLYGGTQDNGTLRTFDGSDNNWQRILGGDGFYVIVDPNNSDIIYAESQWGNLAKSTNGGNNFFNATSGISGSDRNNWMTPFVIDPADSDILYYGTQRIYRTTNAASSWQPISDDLSNGPYPNSNFGTITTIDVSPVNSNTIYAGTDDGNVWVSINGGNSWSLISQNLPERWVTRVVAHPSNATTVIVTFSGFRDGEYVGHIFRSSNLGKSWTDISSNLPEAPIQVMRFDPAYPEVYYVGSDLSVYLTTNAGASWSMLGDNLPPAGVMDLTLHAPTRTLTAATHGRSMFNIDVSNLTAISGPNQSIAEQFTLKGIYPNPFNPVTNIEFVLHRRQTVDVSVFDMLGRKIRTLSNETLAGGTYLLRWDGRDDQQQLVSSGVYLIRLSAGPHRLSRRVTFVK